MNDRMVNMLKKHKLNSNTSPVINKIIGNRENYNISIPRKKYNRNNKSQDKDKNENGSDKSVESSESDILINKKSNTVCMPYTLLYFDDNDNIKNKMVSLCNDNDNDKDIHLEVLESYNVSNISISDNLIKNDKSEYETSPTNNKKYKSILKKNELNKEKDYMHSKNVKFGNVEYENKEVSNVKSYSVNKIKHPKKINTGTLSYKFPIHNVNSPPITLNTIKVGISNQSNIHKNYTRNTLPTKNSCDHDPINKFTGNILIKSDDKDNAFLPDISENENESESESESEYQLLLPDIIEINKKSKNKDKDKDVYNSIDSIILPDKMNQILLPEIEKTDSFEDILLPDINENESESESESESEYQLLLPDIIEINKKSKNKDKDAYNSIDSIILPDKMSQILLPEIEETDTNINKQTNSFGDILLPDII
uniref:Uncharacterized protein n=1 Tax=Pithovirus LCPAC101 TaxID=2506586 RepID=A0A481Z2T5_9VIRU|nr:MAG: hypothetical protein LCPAC101_03210 [Pithovirus LCPAC101]